MKLLNTNWRRNSEEYFRGISNTLKTTLKHQTRECVLCSVLCAYLTAMCCIRNKLYHEEWLSDCVYSAKMR